MSLDEVLDNYEFMAWNEGYQQYGVSFALRADVTDYAVSQGSYSNNGRGAWWLRNPGHSGEETCYVNDRGYT